MNDKPEKKETAWLIDSSIYVFKAWHTRRSDQPTDLGGNSINAVLGFIGFVFRLLSQEEPKLIAFAFDESLETSHRKEIYPEYKANRPSAPESLRYQFRLCREFIRILGIHEAASLHYEADDLIGTWARSLRQENIPLNIITADKDLAQLVYENDHWWEFEHGIKMDTRAITKKFRAKPRQIADQLAIAGDKSDNIPGVPYVGMATAAKLLRKFDNIDNLLASISEISTMKIRGAMRIQQEVEAHQETIIIARKLTGIVCDIEEIDNNIFKVKHFNKEQFLSFSQKLQLSPQKQKEWLKLLQN